MDDQIHIIITGNRGTIHRLPCSRKKLCFFISLTTIIIVFLAVIGTYSIALYSNNRSISRQLTDLREQLRASAQLIADSKRNGEEEQLKLNLKVAKLELSNVRQAAAFRAEKENLLSTAVSELSERSELIEKMINSIGIDVPPEIPDDGKNSGGVFIERPASSRDDLLHRADKYLKAIRYLPFGRPVDGPISSGFGKRTDPVNGKAAFHTGIDFRSKPGDSIYATADGKVQKALFNGSYGNYVLIDHGNGYSTAFSHMKKYVVRRNEKIHRGQLIGFVGNSGRSTGPHLHYEVTLDNDPIDPYTFMKVAGLSESITSSSETH